MLNGGNCPSCGSDVNWPAESRCTACGDVFGSVDGIATPPQRRRAIGLMVGGGLVVAGLVALFALQPEDELEQAVAAEQAARAADQARALKKMQALDRKQREAKYPPSTGEKGYLWLGDGKAVPVAASESALDGYIDAERLDDEHGMTNLLTSGQASIVRANAHVLVLKVGFSVAKVRLLDGKHQGEVAWTVIEALHKKRR